jgi:pyridoxine kinase
MNVLSVQSDVVYGHVGNAAARFALQRLGHEVWAVPTVLLSSHAGYAKVGGESLSADLLRRLVDGLDANGWLGSCDAVLSGYLGHADHAGVVADAVRRVKAANRSAPAWRKPWRANSCRWPTSSRRTCSNCRA